MAKVVIDAALAAEILHERAKKKLSTQGAIVQGFAKPYIDKIPAEVFEQYNDGLGVWVELDSELGRRLVAEGRIKR